MPPEKEENKKRIETKDDVKEIAEIAEGIKAGIKKGRIKAGKITRYPDRFDGKEKRLSFGAYPAVTLSKASNLQKEAKVKLFANIDPGEEKKAEKVEKAAPTFREVALEFVEKQRGVWAPSHTRTVEGRLRLDVYPAFGNTLIAEVTAQDILAVLRKI